MRDDGPIYEEEKPDLAPDPDEIPIRDRRLVTRPYDIGVETLIKQIENGTIFLRPLSDRPSFQRRYVWTDVLASRLIESILLNVPIPPCYLSQNEDFELDVIDGQQRIFTIYRYLKNQYPLSGLEVLIELNGSRFFELPPKLRRQLDTETLRCVLITNDSHPEIKFDVFQRLNTNTVPLNAQELRNCIYRGALNSLLQEVVAYPPWLGILGRRAPDKRMRDEELALRFFAFHHGDIASYRTPQKHWLNDAAKAGMRYPAERIQELKRVWENAVDNSLRWFSAEECFRREAHSRSRPINRAVFDLVMRSASRINAEEAVRVRGRLRTQYRRLLRDEEFNDLISRAVDHRTRTQRRFQMWDDTVGRLFS